MRLPILLLLAFLAEAGFAQSARDLYREGLKLQEQAQHDQAIEAFRKAIASQSSTPAFHVSLGVSLRHLKRYDEALAEFDRALRLNDRVAMGYFERGLVHIALGNPMEAINDFTRQLQKTPNHANSYLNRGIALQSIQLQSEAFADFNRALRIRPESPVALEHRAQIALNHGLWAEAEKDLTAAIQYTGGDAVLHRLRANAWIGLGNRDAAIDDLSHAYLLDPIPQDLVMRGLLRFEAGDRAGACQDWATHPLVDWSALVLKRLACD